MAFFGLTHLGDQNPIGDNMIVNPRGASLFRDGPPPSLQEPPRPLTCKDTCSVSHQPLPFSTDIHHGSYERHREMVKKIKTPRSPNQLYIRPLTESQQYGWMVSKPRAQWTKVKSFPRKNSEMTKFVNEMSTKDREFIMF
ncbi:hypothetical protein NQZ68_019050 [Dissostichus eleginoides]|nr:hypothetical protein NQZ68_019050 [Dissostichus eleginoides]